MTTILSQRFAAIARVAVRLVVALLFILSSHAYGGSGRYNATAQTFNIIVSLSWEATPQQIADIQQRFTQASELLFDVTDGAMRFDRVTIFDGGVGKEFADVDITLGNGTASAPSGPGIFGVSFHLFTDDDIYPAAGDPEADTRRPGWNHARHFP